MMVTFTDNSNPGRHEKDAVTLTEFDSLNNFTTPFSKSSIGGHRSSVKKQFSKRV